MRDFKLISVNKNFKRTITIYNPLSDELFHEPYSTFNEKLTESENDQFQLTFSIAGYVDDHGIARKNHWLDLIKMGSRLILQMDGGSFEVRLIVSKIQPVPSKENIIYNFTADDEVSYLWSRHRLGYSYSNLGNGDVYRLGVENIYDIANNILLDNYLQGQWDVQNTEGEKEYPENALVNKPITLEVLDSNPYNVIIEACNTLGCYLKINYKKQFITFYQKNDIAFSGYRYRAETNLSSFSVDYSGSEFASLLHVTGGTNEYDEIISIVPAIPEILFNYLWKETWWQALEDKWDLLRVSLPTYDDFHKIVTKISTTESNHLDEYEWPLKRLSMNKIVQIKGWAGYVNHQAAWYAQIKYFNNDWSRELYREEGYSKKPGGVNDTTIQENDKSNALLFKLNELSKTQYEHTRSTFEIKTPPLNGKWENGQMIYLQDEALIQQLQEVDKFLTIARKIPHLSQFLIDFSYFHKANLITDDDLKELNKKLNVDMSMYNIYLKRYLSQQIQLQWQVNKILGPTGAQINTIATDFYGSELSIASSEDAINYKLEISNDVKEKYEEDIVKLIKQHNLKNNISLLHGLDANIWTSNVKKTFYNIPTSVDSYQLTVYYRNYETNCPELQEIVDTIRDYNQKYHDLINLYINLRTRDYWSNINQPEDSDEYKTYVLPTKTKLTTIEEELKTLNKLIYYKDGDTLGSYHWLMNLLFTYLNPSLATPYVNSLDAQVELYQNNINQIWKTIYTKYGDYIYEAKYENSDELNSLSLYNQGITYFEKYKRPIPNYSIETIDLGSLELIGLPRLAIGSKIKVYNNQLNLDDNTEDNISYGPNDLITTQLTYDLRNPVKIAVSVEQVQAYNTIVSKLLQSVRL